MPTDLGPRCALTLLIAYPTGTRREACILWEYHDRLHETASGFRWTPRPYPVVMDATTGQLRRLYGD